MYYEVVDRSLWRCPQCGEQEPFVDNPTVPVHCGIKMKFRTQYRVVDLLEEGTHG